MTVEQHPHILPLFDSGEADSFLYYVMPFIDGDTLRSFVAIHRAIMLAVRPWVTRLRPTVHATTIAR